MAKRIRIRNSSQHKLAMAIRAFSERCFPLKLSSVMINSCPPSNIGSGSKLKTARFILIIATKKRKYKKPSWAALVVT